MTDTSPYTTPESEVEPPASQVQSRKELVPTWIKVFGWIFVVLGAIMPLLLAYTLATGEPIQLELFGLNYAGPAANGWAIFIAVLYLFMGVSALGLLLEQDWGLDACIANGIVGLVICGIVIVLSGFTNWRLEPLIQVFYLRRLFIIRPQWRAAPSSRAITKDL